MNCPDCVDKLDPRIDYGNLPAYDAITLHHGFTGFGVHTMIYNRLKERCLRRLIKEHKQSSKDRIMLVSGVRQAESTRRMGTCEESGVEGCRVWVAPLIYWTDADKEAYIHSQGLRRNPVVGKLCMSGECLCGAYAKPGEIKEIEMCYPKAAARIHALEEKARELGVHAAWGTLHPNSKPEKAKAAKVSDSFFGLCWSCENKNGDVP